jgi:hypothetical protein
MSQTEVLPGLFAAPPDPHGIEPSAAVMSLVRGQVKNLLLASPAYGKLAAAEQRELAHNLVKVAAYNAALVRDQWAQAKKLDQVPMVRHQELAEATAKRDRKDKKAKDAPPPPPEEFATRATGSVGKITKDTLNAVAFPVFVSDLLKGTFNAIVDASIKQMEAYGQLLANVAKTVDQFMADNITDNQARDYLATSYPEHFQVEVSDGQPRVKARETDTPRPDFQRLLDVPEGTTLDDDAAEEKFVPAARRRLAENRHQMLSTMVLMGINRIVITSGRIYAKLGFHIDAHDTAQAETASQFDFQNQTEVGAGGGIGALFGGPSFSSKTSVAYVTSSKKGSTDSINVNTDLTAEVDLKFKSDYFPLERFAKTGVIAQIQQNTANPTANAPAGQSTQTPQQGA